MKRLHNGFALLLTLAMVLGLAACAPAGQQGGDATPPAAGTRTTYREMYGNEVETLNYLYSGSTSDLKVCANVVDCLVEYDTYGVMQPALAERWEPNADNTVWTFHIRPGVKWVDATGAEVADVTANDWVSAAKYVLDAVNTSSTEYMYEGIVQGAAEYYAYTAYLVESENGTKTTNADGDPIDVVAPVDFATVGVKALDDSTLEYTMTQPIPYFPSVLSYASYMPVYGPFLEEQGENFGVDNYAMLFNGAYIISDFQPQNQRILTKNASYWDNDNVFIEEIQWLYNASATTIAPESFLRNEMDYAPISSDVLSAWMADTARKDSVSANIVDNAYSYFYCFNFEPRFDAAYEPDNWAKAVNVENFRQSLVHALDRTNAKKVSDPYYPELYLSSTVTPRDFAMAEGLDFTQYEPIQHLAEGDSFDAALAVEFKDKALPELQAAGVTLPVKVLMPYNPATSTDPNWDKECQVIEQQLEGVLGKDYVDVIVEAGPATGFLTEVRKAGKFAFMKCNWGADYADPQTWTDPFNNVGTTQNSTYTFMYTVTEPIMAGTAATSKTAETQSLVTEYKSLMDAAKATTSDDQLRYTTFAQAEALLLDHAFVVPMWVDTKGYTATRLNEFERQYSPYGLASQRYKGMHVYDAPVSMDEFTARYDNWKTERAAAIAAAS